MSVVSIRLNEREEKILNSLTAFFEEDKSSLIKHSLNEMYEDVIDKKEIEDFEKKESQGKVKFTSSDEILKTILK